MLVILISKYIFVLEVFYVCGVGRSAAPLTSHTLHSYPFPSPFPVPKLYCWRLGNSPEPLGNSGKRINVINVGKVMKKQYKLTR